MGWHGSEIGNYRLLMHYSVFDDIKPKKPKNYFERKLLELEFQDNSKQKTISSKTFLPLLELGNLKKNKTTYDFIPKFNLSKLLLRDLQLKKIQIRGIGVLSVYLCEIRNEYFLTSELGKDNITLSSNIESANKFLIKKHSDLEWLLKNGLEFKQV